MVKSMSVVHQIAGSPVTVLVGTITSVLSLAWVTAAFLSETSMVLSVIVMILSFGIFFSLSAYSIRVRNMNFGLKAIAGHIHRINHIYRDVLYECFAGVDPVTNEDDLLQQEMKTIRSVCQRIQNMFSQLLFRECLVTVKLITKDDDGKSYCTTYERSQEKCERDNSCVQAYDVGTQINTAFDKALEMRHDNACSRFYGADLLSDASYNNQRPHWEKFYRSAIVVPIRNPSISLKSQDADDLGFLCVDTMSRNRLNDTYHVDMLAAFGDQMFNFFSLMRGTYQALADERHEIK